MDIERPKPDADITKREKVLIAKLSPKDLEMIDNALLVNARHNWRKVAMIVALTMMSLPSRFKGIPDVYYSERVQILVREGRLESEGDLKYMRFSEVRLPN